MSVHSLDRPIWGALTSRQSAFSEGGALARRYQRGIIPFAATGSDDPDSLRALSALLLDDESLMVAQASQITLPPATVATLTARVVQMIAEKPLPDAGGDEIERLSKTDAQEMLDLATLTKPGPFSLRAGELGEFWGVKRDGRLVAMAGERMKQDGFSELSGVCSHPDVRGQGLGRRLSVFVARRIAARGDVPFLHAWETNHAAIGLYESIGFRLRTTLNLAVIKRSSRT
ncbi:GNAT family N-acetyltransferase [Mesorhizobium sp. LHD-90]|uniref:GNAT family N-acetyltransferase n=1 Tax=Mesorhizobium sp. LHD-90 TaxID=3071414 RepID=UPI0027E10A1E|nr:GNAT family N-acetyltransferase [Mesorhizobium sp. LHD-90]MDQ6433359.1 GNAT family N-acetyltransferase [Mesorhizobium sp. LHD-90]